MNFKDINKVFFMGIGGIGVSAIARMFLLEGPSTPSTSSGQDSLGTRKKVLGSDTAETNITEELRKEGAEIFLRQSAQDVPEDTDLVIYSIAIEKYAPEFFKAVKEKIKNVISYPEALSVISKDKYTIAVAGTHGKTTTTAMIAKIMIDAGLDPTVIVGSLMLDPSTGSGRPSNFIAGRSKYLVVEACEYCRSFLNIHPTIACVTSIDADHLDYYRDLADIEDAFREFVKPAKVIVSDKVTGYRLQVTDKKLMESDKFYDPKLELKMPGEHNRKNGAVALAVADYLGISPSIALGALKDFSGTWRRFEYKGVMSTGAIVYDDYAHHPAEIEATLKGVREKYPDKKITVVFQPHLYSRTKQLFSEFVEALSKADYVMLLPIYKAREENDETVSSEQLVEEIKKKNEYSMYFPNFEEAQKMLARCSSEKDVILVMGAGDITELAGMLV